MYTDKFVFTIKDILKCLHDKKEFIRSSNNLRVLRITNPSENIILVTEYDKSNEVVYSITLKLVLSFDNLKLSVVSIVDKNFKEVLYSSTLTDSTLTILINIDGRDVNSFDLVFQQAELLRAALRLMDEGSPHCSVAINNIADQSIICFLSKAYNMTEIFRISFTKEIDGEDKTIFFYIHFNVYNSKSFCIELDSDEAYVNNNGKLPIRCIPDPHNISQLRLRIN